MVKGWSDILIGWRVEGEIGSDMMICYSTTEVCLDSCYHQ